MVYGIAVSSQAAIYQLPSRTKEAGGVMVSAISDEVLSGMALAVTGEAVNGFLPVRTFYDYTGYVEREAVILKPLEEIKAWEEGGLQITTGLCLDVMSIPDVQGVRLASLYRGSLVRRLPFQGEREGWIKVELADRQNGYVRGEFLGKKEFSQAGLWEEELPQRQITDEEAFRRAVVDTARMYLGIQYRWGGRSSSGLDCSGLTSESYLLNGILIYRDARLKEGFPVKLICPEGKKPGDLLYFPGHIAMYAGNGRYIHSTGKAWKSGVVMNSLNPSDDDYRADLARSLYAAGSIFEGAGLLRR